MSFKVFQDGHLGHRNATILAILNFHVTPIPQIKCQLNSTWLERRCRVNNFKTHAMGHLGYLNETNLAIVNFLVVPMPPIRFQINPTFCPGWLEISKMDATLDIETEQIEQF